MLVITLNYVNNLLSYHKLHNVGFMQLHMVNFHNYLNTETV